MTIGEKLKNIRKNIAKCTLLDVAQATGLSVSFLSDIERGRTNPSLETLTKLSDFYNVPVSDLMSDPDTEKKEPDFLLPDDLKILKKNLNIDDSMIDLMLSIRNRGGGNLKSYDDWLEFYYSLKRLMK